MNPENLVMLLHSHIRTYPTGFSTTGERIADIIRQLAKVKAILSMADMNTLLPTDENIDDAAADMGIIDAEKITNIKAIFATQKAGN